MNNLEGMRKRLEFQGGIAQEDRMIKEKFRTLKKAFYYSYQGCDVQKVQGKDDLLIEGKQKPRYPVCRALINPNKLKPDYDDKVLSIDAADGFQPGDIFTWIGTQTQWIIYLEALTEDAYFRGDIRRCKYQIHFKDEIGDVISTYAAIRGPVETQINSIQKNQVRLDTPNLSLNILIPQNKKTLKAFDRYKEFIFADKCWRVEAPDIISMPGIIEVNAEEYFVDRDKDKTKEKHGQDLKDGLIIKPAPLPPSEINGESFIRPQIEETYTAPEVGGKWCVFGSNKARIRSQRSDSVTIVWDDMTSGKFELRWSKGDKKTSKTIVVESLI